MLALGVAGFSDSFEVLGGLVFSVGLAQKAASLSLTMSRQASGSVNRSVYLLTKGLRSGVSSLQIHEAFFGTLLVHLILTCLVGVVLE